MAKTNKSQNEVAAILAVEQQELGDPRLPEPQRIAASQGGMIATQHFGATQAGAEILAAGGNAIDAAVAAAFALGVCEPAASGLGGQSVMLIHTPDPRRTFALDGSSRAPHRAAPGIFKGRRLRRLRGHMATTVPASPAILQYAVQNYGKLSISEILQPAIRLASEGVPVTNLLHSLTKRELRFLKRYSGGQFFLTEAGRPYAPGATLLQPVLAKTLKRIASHGVEDFYQGRIAKKIHDDMQAHGGLLHRDDLAQIPWPIERKPVTCKFDGLRVITFGPPGAGRTLVEMLHILENFPPELRTADTPEGACVVAEVIRRAFLDRRDRPYDPTFYAQVDDQHMLCDEYAKLVTKQVKRRIKPPEESKDEPLRGETTHLSVMDADGGVVALTQSIERVYGSMAASPDLGFLYNNYMSAFELDDISHPYYLRPNAVPWASVAPTIVFRGRRPWCSIGSPGSERITSSVAQVLMRLTRQSPYDAVAAPRIHCALDGTVHLEAARMRDDIPPELLRRGFQVNPRDAWSFYMGCVQLVLREKKTFIGVADPRRDGAAAGPP